MSDRVDSSILKNMHVTNNLTIANKNWNDFEEAIQNKKIILYGLNHLIDYIWMRCKQNIEIIAAIDNDVNKQGYTLGDLLDNFDTKESAAVKISPRDILTDYDPNEVVILISSYRYYEEIADELDSKGYHCYFSILNLEANFRAQMQRENLPYEDRNEHILNYVKECSEKYPVQPKKIVFSLTIYLDHGKYITEKLLEMDKTLDIVWIVGKPGLKVPKGVRTIFTDKRKQYIYEMETAGFWVYGTGVPAYLIKRKEQVYIQTKHWGSITLKKFHLSNLKNVTVTFDAAKINGELMDYVVSGSEFDENSCRVAFNFKGKFLRFGSPRSDILFSPDKCKEKVFKEYNLKPEEKVLIYAPTFRLDQEKNYFDLKWQGLDFDMLLEALQKKWSGTWKIFLRLHPAVKTRSNQIKKPSYVIDVSEYEDSQELVAASDIMLSDFSSIIFESAYIMRPVFLYAPDKIDYQKNDRELLLDYDSLPFPIAMTNEELANQIKNFDEVKYKETVKAFLDKYGVHEDGLASERTAKFILDLISKNQQS